MKRALLLSVVAGSLVACSEASRNETDLPSAPGVIAAAPPSGGACSARDANGFADDYFATSDLRRTAGELIRAAFDAAPNSATRNDRWFDIFQLIETARAALQVNDPADGAGLILEGKDCGNFVFSHPGTLADLTEALTGGAFAYRAGTEDFVATLDGGAALDTPNWPAWIGGRAMVVGLKLGTAPVVETPVGSFAYRFGLIYDATTAGPSGQDDIASVELCDPAVDYLTEHRVGRVKATGLKTILQREAADIAGFCDETIAPTSLLGRALQKVVGFFTPTPLQAHMMAPPGMAGGIGELSDFTSSDAESVNLTLVTQPPKKGKTNTDLTYTLNAKGAAGTPLENVAFVVSIEGNQGQPAILTQNCSPTDELGNASCVIQISSTGGYELRFTAQLAGYPDASVLSRLINLSQN